MSDITKCPTCNIECYAWRTECPRCNIPLPHARPETLSYDEMIVLIRQVVSAGSMRDWCKRHDFMVSHVSEISRGKRKISARLALALGYRMEIRFVRDTPK